MEFFIDTAWAQAGTQPNSIISFLPLIIIFALFYFLLIRPNSKRQKEHRELVASLEKGQEVVTSGGVLGKVTDVGPTWVTVEVAADVALKVQKSNITAVMPKDTIKSA
ncbi:MAG: preprotein translocase subunit YajC [Gammaproteobacteria bacterium]|nr:preprotein translocase subunit YajC [Gammaproteobacteria bacterium]